MDDIKVENDEIEDEIIPIRRKKDRRQRQQLRFSEEEDEKPEKTPSSFKPPGRASRFLSIADPTLLLPGANLLRLRELHSQAVNGGDLLNSDDIPDELLDKIPFQIEIIPDKRDDLILEESALEKRNKARAAPIEIPAVISIGLSAERRLEIIEEILKKLSQKNVLDEIRQSNAVPYRLPRNNQMQKNVAERIRDLTGSETVILNDHLYMKNLCKRIEEKHKEEREANFERIASNGFSQINNS